MDCATQRTKSMTISVHDHLDANDINFAAQTFRCLHIITTHLSICAIYLIFAVSARWRLLPVPMSFFKKKEKAKGIYFLKFYMWTSMPVWLLCIYFNWIILEVVNRSHLTTMLMSESEPGSARGRHLQGVYQLICQL